MVADNPLDSQSFIQRRALVVVGVVFAVSMAAYAYKFHGPLSDLQDTRGQFGDFMGGVANPIVGFCTVWLLTVSLRQNQLVLKQSYDELVLARTAIEHAEEILKHTKEGIAEQVQIADQTRDMANAVALWKHLKGESAEFDVVIKQASHQKDREKSGIDNLMHPRNAVNSLAAGLDSIFNIEIDRLLN